MRRLVETKFYKLGTNIHIQIVALEHDEQKARQYLKFLENFYQEQQKIFSRFEADSELNFFNTHLGESHKASESFLELTLLCLDYYEKTQHWFDPRVIEFLEKAGYASDFKTADFSKLKVGSFLVPDASDLKKDLSVKGEEVTFYKRMDFSGIAKGFITDKAAQYLKDKGWQDFIIDSGGDIYAAGKNVEQTDWIVSLEGFSAETLLLQLSNQAVATSGISRRKWEVQGQRFHHLINPRDPKNFCFDLRSATVITRTTTDADVWAKVMYLWGKEKGIEFANQNNIRCIYLDYCPSISISKAARENIYKH